MRKIFRFRSLLMMAVSAGFVTLAAGSMDEETKPNTPGPSANEVLNIPDDSQAGPAPSIVTPNATLPNASVNVDEQDGYKYLAIDMTGVWNEIENDWLELAGTSMTGQNVWVSIDDTPKGVDVYNNSMNDSRKLLADVVFLVDNSGSMSEEAEAVANSIMSWSEMLSKSGLDVHVGCVGYGDSNHAIDGAFNMNTPAALAQWMQGNGYGVYRTHFFGGSDAGALQAKAQGGNYENGSYAECGMVALHFAHDNYNFRSGANRIYVNFTDEPNQPSGNEKWSVEYLNPEKGNWKSNYGTIHSVYSDKKFTYNSILYSEQPWLMAEYTGGTQLFTDRNFSDFTLENLPVTGAMQNSYVLRITNIDNLFDGKEHKITITVFTKDGAVMAEKTILFTFTTGE